jgi:hypothetical protein
MTPPAPALARSDPSRCLYGGRRGRRGWCPAAGAARLVHVWARALVEQWGGAYARRRCPRLQVEAGVGVGEGAGAAAAVGAAAGTKAGARSRASAESDASSAGGATVGVDTTTSTDAFWYAEGRVGCQCEARGAGGSRRKQARCTLHG